MKWGITRLVFLKATLNFILFMYLRSIGLTIIAIPFLYASLVASLATIASHPCINLPTLFGKKTDGSFPTWSMIIFGPFLCFVWLFSMIKRVISKEEAYSEIHEGVYVGGWPCNVSSLPHGNPAIIDCTCELPRMLELVRNGYMCLPTWDTRAPSTSEIESAVMWGCLKRAQGFPVFVHCAYGHGRSVAVMCALLVELGLADDWKHAEKIIQRRRPSIRMNSLHRKALQEWSNLRLSPIKKNCSLCEGQGV